MQLSRGEDGEPESSAPSSFAPSIRRCWRPVLLWQDAFGTLVGFAPPRGCSAPSWCCAMKRASRQLFGDGREFPLRALVVEHDVRKCRDHHDGNDVRVARWPSCRVILSRNHVLGEPAAAIAPARTSAAIGARAPRNTIWVDDDRDFYGEIRRGACAMLGGSAHRWGRLW